MTHYFTISEAARLLDISESRLRRMFQDGRLAEPARYGHARLITQADIDMARLVLQGRGGVPVPGDVGILPLRGGDAGPVC